MTVGPEVTVANLGCSNARLGFAAPPELRIDRSGSLPPAEPVALTPEQERLGKLCRVEQDARRVATALHDLRATDAWRLACDTLRAVRAEIAELGGTADE